MELTDDEFMDLLEQNGIDLGETDEKFQQLKEDLYDGKIILLDATGLSLQEGSDPDYGWMQLLKKNGFAVNENNVQVLKDANKNGHALILTEWWVKDAIHKHKVRKLRRKQMKKINDDKKAEKEAETTGNSQPVVDPDGNQVPESAPDRIVDEAEKEDKK